MTQRDLTQCFLLSFLALLFTAAIGGFLLYVPMMSGIVVVTMLVGMLCMFALGFIARGSRRRFASPHMTAPPPDAKSHDTKVLHWPATDFPGRPGDLRISPR